MTIFNNKKIYIAPKSPLSIALKNYISKHTTCQVISFIDKNKNDYDISKIENIQEDTLDYIIILSPNHYQYIYEEYLSYINSKKLYIAHIENQLYHFTQECSTRVDDSIELYSKKLDEQSFQRSKVVFISKGFIGANNKFFYLYCLKATIPCTIVTDNKSQLRELNQYNLPYEELYTVSGNQAIASAKYIIFDQGNYTHFYISPMQYTIQLWHGVGLKKMSKQTHINYDYFISTSKWTNETNFTNIFLSKKFLDYGYPRNEFLLKKSEDDKDLLFCDKALYQTVKNKSFTKTVLYMPTTREYLFTDIDNIDHNDLLPLNFTTLNQDLSDLNILMIVKLHPFVVDFFAKTQSEKNFSNLIFHPASGDIYPILKYIDILVSDYSSIIYDFLLLDRPIIFFDYDREQYANNMGGFLFDYTEFSPGIQVKTQEELIKALSTEDLHQLQRHKIKELFFSNTVSSCQKIHSLIRN